MKLFKCFVRMILVLIDDNDIYRYIHILLGDTKSLEIYYEKWALLRDHEKNSMLPNMAAGEYISDPSMFMIL